jgi:hypothetical protein
MAGQVDDRESGKADGDEPDGTNGLDEHLG